MSPPIDHAADEFIRRLLEEEEKPLALADIWDDQRERPITRSNLYTHHDTHPIILAMALLKEFGSDWLEWESETLKAEIKSHHGGGVSELNWNQIQAVKTIHLHDGPWHAHEAFVPVILALNNNIPIFTVLHKPTIAQLMAGVDMMNQLRQEEFNEEIKRFIAACFLDENVVYAPEPLAFAQENISQPMYRCPDCGNEDADDLVDGVCDVCAERFEHAHPFSYRPNPEVVDKINTTKEGTRIERFLLYPPDEVRAAYAKVEGLPADEVPLQETVIDIQVAKLLVARDYMNMRRQQLREQTQALQLWLGGSGD